MFYTTKYMEPLTDFGFKKIFASEESTVVLKSFLFNLLELESPIAEISILSPEQLPGRPGEQIGIYDVYCVDEREQRFIVEMQKKKQNFFTDRLVYYSSFPISQQAEKGEWDYELDPIYCLGILDFDLFSDDRFIRHAKLTDTLTGEIYYDKLTFAIIELRKFHRSLSELETHQDKWIYFLKHLTDFDDIPEELSDAPFQEAFHIAEMGALTEAEWYYYEGSLKKMRDDYAVMQTAKQEKREAIEASYQKGQEEGRAESKVEGIEEGRQVEKIEIAKKLIQQRIPIETIIQATGLTQGELEALIP